MSGAYVDSCKKKAFAVLFFVFVTGMAAGALSLKVYQRRAGGAADSAAEAHAHEPSLAVEHLREELDLNNAQLVEVQSVLDECIMKEADLLTQLVITRTDGRERIFNILNNGQRKKFEEMLTRVADGSLQ